MSELGNVRYIVIEGPIGVGKTTAVESLAQRLEARTVFEVFEENPFLASFYEDPERFAFSTEMFFLLSRFNQQEEFAQEDLLRRYAVSDYLFEKCRIFAKMTLDDAELRLFDRMYEILCRQIPTPDVVVHLHAPIDVLLERIKHRGRDYEKSIEPEYLERLDASYWQLFQHHSGRVVSVDTTNVDFRQERFLDRLFTVITDGRRGIVDLSDEVW